MHWLKKLISRNIISGISTHQLIVANAERRRDKDPRFFSIPRREQRLSIEIGDEVMIFIQSPEVLPNNITVGEDVWVEVVDKQAGRYIARPKDALRMFPNLENSTFEFGPECISGVKLPETHVLPYTKSCLVSNSVLVNDAWPVNLRRLQPEMEQDSGWRVFAQGETFSDATLQCQVHQLIAKFQVLDSVLDEPELVDWVWRQELNEYQRLHGEGN